MFFMLTVTNRELNKTDLCSRFATVSNTHILEFSNSTTLNLTGLLFETL
jgi:hypothetical protein